MSELTLHDVEKRLIRLETKLKEFFELLRRATIQETRAREKVIARLRETGKDETYALLKNYFEEGRRSDLQIVRYLSRETGLKDYQKKRFVNISKNS